MHCIPRHEDEVNGHLHVPAGLHTDKWPPVSNGEQCRLGEPQRSSCVSWRREMSLLFLGIEPGFQAGKQRFAGYLNDNGNDSVRSEQNF